MSTNDIGTTNDFSHVNYIFTIDNVAMSLVFVILENISNE